MSPRSIPDVLLNDGTTLPSVGFGTYLLNGQAGVNSMIDAVKSGYRLFDSAFNYENEGAVGFALRAAVQQGLVAREQLRVTSKLPGRHHAHDKALKTIEESVYRSGLDYFDLYLIHWPNPKKGLYVEAWRALIEARERGLVRSIGVCNFLPEHLERLRSETGVLPSVNQIELHPYFPQAEQRAWHEANGVVTESWSPLGRASQVLNDPTIQAIANDLGKSIPQVILRWHVQLGAIALPKATSPARQVENLSLFDFSLNDEQMAQVASLARPDGRLQGQDPAQYEEF